MQEASSRCLEVQEASYLEAQDSQKYIMLILSRPSWLHSWFLHSCFHEQVHIPELVKGNGAFLPQCIFYGKHHIPGLYYVHHNRLFFCKIRGKSVFLKNNSAGEDLRCGWLDLYSHALG